MDTIPNSLLADALRHHQSGRLDEAETGYRSLLRLNPEDPQALHFLGLIHLQRDDAATAAELIAQALRIRPDESVYLCNLGQAEKRLDHPAEAEAAYRRAIELAPGFFEAWHNLALLHEERADDLKAVACYLQARKLSPAKPYQGEANLVGALVRAGRTQLDLGHAPDAVELFRQAIQLAGDDADAWSGLASAQTLAGKPLQAMAAFERAMALRPEAAHLYNNRANAKRDAGLLDEALADYQTALRLAPTDRDAHSNLLFASLASTNVDAAGLADLQRRHAAAMLPEARPCASRPHIGNGRSRLGIVSADLYRHPVAWFLLAWFRHRDREAFHVTVYATGPRQDEVSLEIRAACDAWVDCATMDDATLASQIRRDGIDLLLDLAGHTADNRLGVFALCPAPHQATYLGYAGSTGLACFHARLADWETEPAGAESLSSEPLVRLAGSYLCYTPPGLDVAVTPPPVLKSRHLTFGCAAQLAKVTETTLDLWAGVLAAIPRARLSLRSLTLDDPLVRKRLLGRMAKAGMDTKRVRLEGPRPLAQHLAAWQAVDVSLDTLPFNLATQTCESLWMGVPVVSLAGERHAARLGASLLRGAGLPECVAADAADFVRICAELAEQPERLRQWRDGMRERLLAPRGLMDGHWFTQRLDEALASVLSLPAGSPGGSSR